MNPFLETHYEIRHRNQVESPLEFRSYFDALEAFAKVDQSHFCLAQVTIMNPKERSK